MSHKFDFNNKKNLTSNKRGKLLPAMETLSALGLKKGDTMADIGSGIGYFTFPASEIVGAEGKVYAMDISSEMLREIEKIVEAKNIYNIELVKTTKNNMIIDNGSVNFAFASIVLHEVDALVPTLLEIKRIMTQDSKISLIEWKKVKNDLRPTGTRRLDPNILIKKMKEIGFKGIKYSELNEYLYTIIGHK